MELTTIVETRQPRRLTVPEPQWPDVERAISEMDGEDRSCLVLAYSNENYMTIGGGGRAGLMVEIYSESHVGAFKFWDLLNPAETSREPVPMTVDETTFIERRMCVCRADALKAAKTYLETGAFDETLLWDER